MNTINSKKMSLEINKENYPELLPYMTELAERGDVVAQAKLARFYDNEECGQHDVGLAIQWYWRSAKQGHVDSLFNLAQMCISSDSIPSSYDLAYLLLRDAALLGDMEAVDQMSDLVRDAQVEEGWLTNVNGYTCESISSAALIVARTMAPAKQAVLVEELKVRWNNEFNRACAVARQSGCDRVMLSHLAAEIANQDGLEFMADLRGLSLY